MVTKDDKGFYIVMKTTAEIHQAIADKLQELDQLNTPELIRHRIANEIQELNQAERQARAAYSSEMQRIEARRDELEEMWRKTYETD